MKRINDIRLRVQCENFADHAKILPIGSFVRSAPEIPRARPARNYPEEREWKIYFARRVGEVICGIPGMYVYKPGARSPIGRCAVCGGALSFEVQDEMGRPVGAELRVQGGEQIEVGDASCATPAEG
ncbi:MAG: hypothetical protein WBQ94_04205 [Terracidiphilus sp.]